MVDRKKLQFTVAVDISYIDPVVQQWLYEYIRENGFIKPAQVIALRKFLLWKAVLKIVENVGYDKT